MQLASRSDMEIFRVQNFVIFVVLPEPYQAP